MRDGHWRLEACRILRRIEETSALVYAAVFMWRGGVYEGLVPLLEVFASGVQVWGGQALSHYQVNYKDSSVTSLLPAGICHSV